MDNNKKQKKKQALFRVIKKTILTAEDQHCRKSQETLAKEAKLNKRDIKPCADDLVADGKLVRFLAKNKNYANPRHIYHLPSKSDTQVKINRIGSIQEMRLVGTSIWNIADRLDLIDMYLKSGLNVIPVIRGGSKDKHPKFTKKYWNDNFRHNDVKIVEFFAANADFNVGCWMPSNLMVVDLDYPADFYKLNGGEDYDTLTSSSGRGVHYWMLHNGRIGSYNGVRYNEDGLGILDYKTNESLVILPPSIHKSGRKYEWTNLTDPMPAPQLIYDLYEDRLEFRQHKASKTANTDIPAVDNTAFAAPAPIANQLKQPSRFVTDADILTEGLRYPQLFRLGRAMRTTATFEQIEQELRRLNGVVCKPALEEDKMQTLIKHVKYAPDRPGFKPFRRVNNGS